MTLSCVSVTLFKCDTPYILSGTVVLFPQHYRKLLLNRYAKKKKPICDLFLLRRRAFCPATDYSKRHARLFPRYLYLQGSKNLIIIIIICQLDLCREKTLSDTCFIVTASFSAAHIHTSILHLYQQQIIIYLPIWWISFEIR